MMKLGFYFIFLPALLYAIQRGEIFNITPIALAKTFSYLASIDAISGTFFPITAFSWFGIKIDKGSISHFFSEAIGVHASGLAITSYLITTQKTSLEKAIAYGHLARIVGISKMFVSGRIFKLGLDPYKIVAAWTVLFAIVHNLLHNVWEPMLCALIFAVIMILMSAMIMFNTATTVKFLLKYDIKDKTSTDIARMLGLYLFLNGLYLSIIGNNIDPIKAVGFTSMAMLPFMPYIKTTEIKCCGIDKESMILFTTLLLGTISAGTLLEINL